MDTFYIKLAIIGASLSEHHLYSRFSGGERSDAVVRLKLLWTIDSCHYNNIMKSTKVQTLGTI